MIGGSHRRQNLLALSRISCERNDDDEEEAARERRRRARQERLRLQREEDGEGPVTEKAEVNAQNSVTEEVTQTTSKTIEGSADEEAALLDRLAKREERRQRRLQEALERQRELDPTITDETLSLPKRSQNNEIEENETAVKDEKAVTRRSQYEFEETETVTKSSQKNDWRQEEEKKEDIYDAKEEEKAEPTIGEENQIRDEKGGKEKAPKDDVKPSWDRKKGFPETKAQNGESVHGFAAHKLKHQEKSWSTSSVKAQPDGEEVEAGKRLEDLRRRRGETESEEFEKMKQKQQQAAVELEELKKKREERRKILEEEEQRRKQEQAQQRAKEEEEKRRLKEEIEKRRAEAAEKRQKVPEDGLVDEKKPFKCFTPKGSSLKIEERAEFLNRSAQKSGAKASHPATAVSKIDSRLEQYTSAIEGTKSSRPARAGASDLPLPAEGVRNIKNMWEKGKVFSSPGAAGTPNKEAAGLKVGVSSRINEWLTKTPEGNNKSPPPKPSDLKPGDVSGKRNLWEKQSSEKPASPSKVAAVGKNKAATNGLRQYEKEP
ncbi:non-muscle caldesmon-like isoform X2 [Rhinatrema bivittatum]|uniref:non-muscle caldesmon-like isoform X2 n=1 Tax=Rhinatrema bivittatum TaxID=194408 RepID=UPI00112AA440|nr:non-muscle caldesmon-like isoform X2 [Rhinatrema bivittatum]